MIRLYISVLAIVILVASCNSRDAAISHALDLAGDSIPGGFSRYVDVFIEEKENPIRLKVYGLNK